jgi:bifunctional DNA-binding transcriptional regulator/antitoxin component of YhaV-PrlF toxin-antitoxin module
MNPWYSKDVPKVTSKLQLTVPKAIADEYGIRPGDELQWVPAGEVIRVIPSRRGRKRSQAPTVEERLELFDKATQRQRRRQESSRKSGAAPAKSEDRGWKREELYRRGLSD